MFSQPIKPYVYHIQAPHGANEAVTFPGTAVYTQIVNAGTFDVTVLLNSDPALGFTLADASFMEFQPGALHLTSLEIQNGTSGAGVTDVTVIIGYVDA